MYHDKPAFKFQMDESLQNARLATSTSPTSWFGILSRQLQRVSHVDTSQRLYDPRRPLRRSFPSQVIGVAGYGALGHAPLDLQQFNFFSVL